MRGQARRCKGGEAGHGDSWSSARAAVLNDAPVGERSRSVVTGVVVTVAVSDLGLVRAVADEMSMPGIPLQRVVIQGGGQSTYEEGEDDNGPEVHTSILHPSRFLPCSQFWLPPLPLEREAGSLKLIDPEGRSLNSYLPLGRGAA